MKKKSKHGVVIVILALRRSRQEDQEFKTSFVERFRPAEPSHATPIGRQRQINLCEFDACLVYRVSCRMARAVTWRNPVSGMGRSSLSLETLLHREVPSKVSGKWMW